MKIIAIFIIVVSHVTQTLSGDNSCIDANGYVINFNLATLNYKQLALTFFRYSGILGNDVFFVASAWFLLETDKWSKKKELSLAIDVWFVSIIIMVVMVIAQVKVSSLLIFKSLFPNIFANNWYVTCYLLFYPVHGIFNIIINQIGQKSMFRLCLAFFFLYMGINFLINGLFFPSMLIIWSLVYLILAYGKLFLPKLVDSKKINAFLIAFGLLMNALLILTTNIIGLRITALNDKLFYWDTNYNPFLLMTAIGVFNIARQHIFYNRYINYVSGLSLLIYIIHENILVRSYLRPAIWQWLYEKFGYYHILLLVLGLSVAFFAISAILATIYKFTIGKVSSKIKDWIYDVAKKEYVKVERKILSL